jgi:hypothetical protein
MRSYAMTAVGQAQRLGITDIAQLKQALGKTIVDRATGYQGYNPAGLGEFREPGRPCRPEGQNVDPDCLGQANDVPFGFASLTNLVAAYINPTSPASFGNDQNLNSGYARLAHAAQSFLLDVDSSPTRTGTRAWAWFEGNIKYRNTDGDDPSWVMAPTPAVTNVRINGTTMLVTAPNGAACGIAYNPASSLDSGDTAIAAGSRARSVDTTGHTGETYRLTCGSARVTGTLP